MGFLWKPIFRRCADKTAKLEGVDVKIPQKKTRF